MDSRGPEGNSQREEARTRQQKAATALLFRLKDELFELNFAALSKILGAFVQNCCVASRLFCLVHVTSPLDAQDTATGLAFSCRKRVESKACCACDETKKEKFQAAKPLLKKCRSMTT